MLAGRSAGHPPNSQEPIIGQCEWAGDDGPPPTRDCHNNKIAFDYGFVHLFFCPSFMFFFAISEGIISFSYSLPNQENIE